jgi:predicted component of type VI protein secretion system
MCIATDGFSSAEFKDIFAKLDALARDSKQLAYDKKVIEDRMKEMEDRANGFESTVSEVNSMKIHNINFKTELEDLSKSMQDTLTNSFDEKMRNIGKEIDMKVRNKIQEETTTLEENLNKTIQGNVSQQFSFEFTCTIVETFYFIPNEH